MDAPPELLVVAPLEGPQRAEVRAVEQRLEERAAGAQVVMLAVRSRAELSAAVTRVERSLVALSAAVMLVEP